MKIDEQLSGIEIKDEISSEKVKEEPLEILKVEKKISELGELVDFSLNNQENTSKVEYYELAVSYYNKAIKELNTLENLTEKQHPKYITNANKVASKILACAQKIESDQDKYKEVLSLAQSIASGVVAEQINFLLNKKDIPQEEQNIANKVSEKQDSVENASNAKKKTKWILALCLSGVLAVVAAAVSYIIIYTDYYKRLACELGDGVACGILGFKSGDINKAISFYEKACALGVGADCLKLGIIFRYNIYGLANNINKANYFYEKACDLGNHFGCTDLGIMYENGNGVAKDINKANSLYEKACELGRGEACSYLGVSYENGNGVAKDINKAYSLYEKACELSDGLGCFFLGVSYENGNGVAKDINKAYSLYEKACELSYGVGCFWLGVRYENGNGVAKDINKAYSLYEKACRLGFSGACREISK